MPISIFRYNCEKYSAKDIAEFVASNGYKVDYYNDQDQGGFHGYKIAGMNIEIRMPEMNFVSYIKTDPIKWLIGGVPDIYFDAVNSLYYRKNQALRDGALVVHKQLEQEYYSWHQEAKKIYDQLKKTFGLKEYKTLEEIKKAAEIGEYPMGVKDLDFIKSLNKRK